MAGYEIYVVGGNLGWDVNVEKLDDDTPFMRNCIAVNRKYTDNNGKKVDKTKWVHFTLWDTQAENAGKYLEKGRFVILEGKLKEGDDGNPTGYYDDAGQFIPKFEFATVRCTYGPGGGTGSGRPGPDPDSRPRQSNKTKSKKRTAQRARGSTKSKPKSDGWGNLRDN